MCDLKIALKGINVNPYRLVGNTITGDLFKLSGANEIEISGSDETLLLVNKYFLPDQDKEWNAYISEMRNKGWDWSASWSYMVFRRSKEIPAITTDDSGKRKFQGEFRYREGDRVLKGVKEVRAASFEQALVKLEDQVTAEGYAYPAEGEAHHYVVIQEKEGEGPNDQRQIK